MSPAYNLNDNTTSTNFCLKFCALLDVESSSWANGLMVVRANQNDGNTYSSFFVASFFASILLPLLVTIVVFLRCEHLNGGYVSWYAPDVWDGRWREFKDSMPVVLRIQSALFVVMSIAGLIVTAFQPVNKFGEEVVCACVRT